jgi:DNA ligase 4
MKRINTIIYLMDGKYFNNQRENMGKSETPDVYIDPKNSIILEIKCYSITETKKFECGFTLRFPRVKNIREDKNWYECLDDVGLNDLINNDIKTTKLFDNIRFDNKVKSDKRNKEKDQNMNDNFKNTIEKGIEVKTSLFKDFEFNILSTDSKITKAQLELLIIENGGKKTQNPTSSTTHFITSHNSRLIN